MENPEEVLHTLEEFSKVRPKDIPRELEDYLCFVAKTGDPVYQWSTIKCLFREKLINVINEFYESCPSIDIPPCPNVDVFNYEAMKSFILEKLDTFAAAPFTVQRICELLTTPRKEYNRIDKYMRALEKNILVVSTTEPGNRRNAENGDSIVNGLEGEHASETSHSSNDINVEEMDDTPSWPRHTHTEVPTVANLTQANAQTLIQETFISESRVASETTFNSSSDTAVHCRGTEEPYVSIEPVPSNDCRQEQVQESDVSVTITAIPPEAQKTEETVEPVVSTESDSNSSLPLKVSDPEDNEAEVSETAESKSDVKISSEEEPNIDSTSPAPEPIQKEPSSAVETSSESSKSTEDIPIEEKEASSTSTPIEEDVIEKSEDHEDDTKKVDISTAEESPDVTNDTTTKVLQEDNQSNEDSKADIEFEDNSKDSEVSSSSSVTSSEDTCEASEDVQKENDVAEKSTPSIASDTEGAEESNDAVEKPPEEVKMEEIKMEENKMEEMKVEEPEKVEESEKVSVTIDEKSPQTSEESQMEVDTEPAEETSKDAEIKDSVV